MDFSFLNHEALKNMDAKKVALLKELAVSTEGKSMNEIAPLLMQTMKKMQNDGTAFTPDESAVMMEILTRNMSPQEKAKVEMIKKMMKDKK